MEVGKRYDLCLGKYRWWDDMVIMGYGFTEWLYVLKLKNVVIGMVWGVFIKFVFFFERV